MTKRTNARRIPVNLGIARGIGADGFPRYTIDIIDDLSGYPVAQVELTGDQFARAITGQMLNRVNGTIPSPDGAAHLGLKEQRLPISGFPRDWTSENPALQTWVKRAQDAVGAKRTAVRSTNTGSPTVTFYWYVDPLTPGMDLEAIGDTLVALRDEAVERERAGRSTTT